MKWFNNLKMIQKLVSAFVLVALFIGVVGFIGMSNMSNIDENLKSIYNNNLKDVDDIVNIKANLLEIRGDLLLVGNPINKSDLQKNKDSITGLESATNALMADYKTTITTDLDRQQFTEFEKLLQDL